MFFCMNPVHTGREHQCHTSIEAKMCYGIIPAHTLTVPVPPRVTSTPARATGMATAKQIDYIGKLGGDALHAYKLTWQEASREIDRLKATGGKPVTSPPVNIPDKRLDFIAGILPTIKEGYYAVQEYEGGDVTFMRLSRPSKGQYRGAVKIQTVHGTGGYSTGSVRLKDGLVYWPSGRWTREQPFLIDKCLLLAADSFSALRRYAEKMERCCRCNAHLTDKQSRHYSIGPECVKYWPWIVSQVDDANEAAADA